MRNKIVALVIAGLTALSVSACDQIPSFDEADKTANAAACQSVSTTWETLNSALSTGDIVGLPLAISTVPTQLDQVISGATDQQLLEALADLKQHVQSVIDGNQADLAGLVASGVGISGRCAILGAAVDFEIPKLP